MAIQDTKRVTPSEDCAAVDVYADDGIVVLRQDDDRIFLTRSQLNELAFVLDTFTEDAIETKEVAEV